MPCRLLAALLLLLVPACAVDATDEPSAEEAEELKDEGKGVSGDKICVKVTSPTNLHVTATGPALVVPQSYGTTDIDGGGVTFGYLPVGAPLYALEDDEQAQSGEHCQVDETEKVCNANAAPGNAAPKMIWTAVWGMQGGRTLHGWVPKTCLRTR